jgi:glycerol-3-phosphate acyltransferase PlsY
MTSLLLALALSYLIGSIPFALVAGRLKGIDLRQHGSGNAGATNAFRVLGPGIGVAVFAADAFKGLVATLVLSRPELWIPAFGDFPNVFADATVTVLCGLAAMLGHMVTFVGALAFGGWKGGKGVATGAGMLLGLVPTAVLVAFLLFTTVVWLTRYVSLGSILAAASLPLTLLVQTVAAGDQVPLAFFVFCALLPLLIVYTHRANVQRLLQGKESRIGISSPPVS